MNTNNRKPAGKLHILSNTQTKTETILMELK